MTAFTTQKDNTHIPNYMMHLKQSDTNAKNNLKLHVQFIVWKVQRRKKKSDIILCHLVKMEYYIKYNLSKVFNSMKVKTCKIHKMDVNILEIV